ncbi:MAG: molybdenum cofactor guanylyltransferase [Firmicutes bacterium]|nr:molybdenum cofactor guanylyltransferase [Bacillota bacterium]
MKVGDFREKSIGLLILAGGKSGRMGREKSTLLLGDKTFSQHIGEAMGEYNERLFSTNGAEVPAGFLGVADDPDLKWNGPAAGIISALEVCKSEWLMVVPCDAPNVDYKVCEELWKVASCLEKPAPVLAANSGGIEPLIALYPKAVCDIMRQRLTNGTRKVLDVISDTGYVLVPIDDKKLVNINWPKDYMAVKENYEKG